MIFKFYKNPEDVLSEFYFNCGIETKLYQNQAEWIQQSFQLI